MKKYTVFRSVTAAPAAAKSKVEKSGSLLKIGLDIHRRARRSVLLRRNSCPGFKRGCKKALKSTLSMKRAGLATGSAVRCSGRAPTAASSPRRSSMKATPE
jgi:hypothetical protein